MKIEIKMIDEDFEQLSDSYMEWGKDWAKQGKRFEPAPSFDWKFAYWFKSYEAVLLARTFLNAKNFETQTVWDRAVNDYLILTNYVIPGWEN